MDQIVADLITAGKINIINWRRVRDIKDLLKINVQPKLAGVESGNGTVYCEKRNGSHVYYNHVRLDDGLGIVFAYYIVTEIEPLEFLWWNIDTRKVTSHTSPRPSKNSTADHTEVFPIVVTESSPEWCRPPDH